MMIKQRILIFAIILGMFVLPLINAEQQSLGVVKQGDCIQLVQTYSNSTYTNFTRMLFPDKSVIYYGIKLSKHGADYNLTYCNTTQLGEYQPILCTDVDKVDTCVAYSFEVTKYGSLQTTTQGLYSIAFIFLVVTLTLIFGFIGYKALNNDLLWAGGIFFIILSLLFLVYDVWLLYELKLSYAGSITDADIPQILFTIFITILLAGLLTAGIMSFTKWRVIRDKFKNAIKPDQEEADDPI